MFSAAAMRFSPFQRISGILSILRALAFLLFLAQVIVVEKPTPILSDPKLTPGDTFDVTAQDVVCSWLCQEGTSSTSIA